MRKINMITLLSGAMIACSMTANAQNTLTLEEGNNEVTALEQGSYDRIEYHREIIAGQLTLISFPAQLDGYYFGPDAERYIATNVEKDGEGNLIITTKDMEDSADFMPGVKYVVKPTQDLETITCVSPAKKTYVPATTTPLVVEGVEKSVVTTAISEVTAAKEADNTVTYDLSGRRQSSAAKQGIFIQNKHKVLIKE